MSLFLSIYIYTLVSNSPKGRIHPFPLHLDLFLTNMQYIHPITYTIFVSSPTQIRSQDLKDGKGTKDFMVRWASSTAEARHSMVRCLVMLAGCKVAPPPKTLC